MPSSSTINKTSFLSSSTLTLVAVNEGVYLLALSIRLKINCSNSIASPTTVNSELPNFALISRWGQEFLARRIAEDTTSEI